MPIAGPQQVAGPHSAEGTQQNELGIQSPRDRIPQATPAVAKLHTTCVTAEASPMTARHAVISHFRGRA